MSEIKVSFAALASADADVTSAAARLNSRLDDLRRYLAPLAATWVGQASEDYRLKQKQWDTAAADLNLVLGQIGRALGSANDAYTQAETANARRWA